MCSHCLLRSSLDEVNTKNFWKQDFLVHFRFMRTRLDQVLEVKLGMVSKEEALKSAGELPSFEEPEIWRAPYARYAPGWWEAFYPPKE